MTNANPIYYALLEIAVDVAFFAIAAHFGGFK